MNNVWNHFMKVRAEALGFTFAYVQSSALPWQVNEGGSYATRCYATVEELEGFIAFVESVK